MAQASRRDLRQTLWLHSEPWPYGSSSCWLRWRVRSLATRTQFRAGIEMTCTFVILLKNHRFRPVNSITSLNFNDLACFFSTKPEGSKIIIHLLFNHLPLFRELRARTIAFLVGSQASKPQEARCPPYRIRH